MLILSFKIRFYIIAKSAMELATEIGSDWGSDSTESSESGQFSLLKFIGPVFTGPVLNGSVLIGP